LQCQSNIHGRIAGELQSGFFRTESHLAAYDGGFLIFLEGSVMSATTSLLEVFSKLEDPRQRRGVRHPFAGIVVLTLLGMLARIREMEVLVRWATVHWDALREPLGFDREQPPCATTISRTLAKCSVDDFQKALDHWLRHHVAQNSEGVLAVDGKTAKQGIDSDGNPLHMLNALVHDVQAVVGQWSTGDDKTNEPSLFRRKLRSLLAAYPMLQLITGDAMFAQRPLIKMIRSLGKDYLFQVKGNQGDTLDALENCFAKASQRAPAALMDEKRGRYGSSVVYGWI
jgi:hypothetical protein